MAKVQTMTQTRREANCKSDLKIVKLQTSKSFKNDKGKGKRTNKKAKFKKTKSTPHQPKS